MMSPSRHASPTVSKRENSSFRKIVLLNIASTYTTVWLLCNLSLDGNLCLHDDKNAASTYTTVWLLCNLSLDGNLCLHDDKNAALG